MPEVFADQKILQAVEKSCRHPVDGKWNRHGSKQFAHRFPLTGKGVVGVSGKPFFQRHGNQTGDKTGTFPTTRPATAWNAVSSMPFPACTDRSAIHFPRVQAVPPADRTREFLPAFSIVITVDTGVDAAGEHGKAKERKEGAQRSSPRKCRAIQSDCV